MRQIKFRAWDLKDKIMINEALLIMNIGIGEGLVLMNERTQTEHGLKWMQFTGAKDRNERDIYEGDILLGRFNPDEVEDYLWIDLTDKEKETGEKIFVVGTLEDFFTTPIPEDLEVIGNIFENKDLIPK